jgi:hypothetical protein
MGVSLKKGYSTPQIIHLNMFNGLFHERPSSYWGTPMVTPPWRRRHGGYHPQLPLPGSGHVDPGGKFLGTAALSDVGPKKKSNAGKRMWVNKSSLECNGKDQWI